VDGKMANMRFAKRPKDLVIDLAQGTNENGGPAM